MNKIGNKKIKEVCHVKQGYAFRSGIPHDSTGTIPLIQPKDISDEGELLTKQIIRTEMPSIKSTQWLKNNDVLLVNRGRFVSTMYHDDVATNCIASGSILILTPHNNQDLLPEYLALYFNSKMGAQHLLKLTEHSTIPYISRSNLLEMRIPVPPLAKQQTLIKLERTKQRYARLTRHKLKLFDAITNHELTAIE